MCIYISRTLPYPAGSIRGVYYIQYHVGAVYPPPYPAGSVRGVYYIHTHESPCNHVCSCAYIPYPRHLLDGAGSHDYAGGYFRRGLEMDPPAMAQPSNRGSSTQLTNCVYWSRRANAHPEGRHQFRFGPNTVCCADGAYISFIYTCMIV